MSKSISILLIMQVIVLSCGSQRERLDFAPASGSPFAVGGRPGSISVGDVNNDHKLDVVTANEGSRDVTILLATAAAPLSRRRDRRLRKALRFRLERIRSAWRSAISMGTAD
jgi:hypothetical protein